MKRLVVFIVSLLICCDCFSQTGTTSQMEAKFRSLYRNGIAAIESQDYLKAEDSFKASIAFLKENGATNNQWYISSSIKLCETYHALSNNSSAAEVLRDIIAFKNKLEPGSKLYFEYVLKFGDYYLRNEQYDKAMSLYDEALSYKATNDIVSRILYKKAFCYYCKGEMKNAISFAEKCIEYDENMTPDYVKSLAHYFFKANQWDRLEKSLQNAFQYSRESVLRQFSQSQREERNSFWSNAGSFFTDYIPTFAYFHSSASLVSYAYDAALFSKGILLAAEVKSNELTLDSDDPELIRLFAKYQELKRKKERSLSEEVEIESISKVLLRHQRQNKYEFRKDFRISWESIRDRLKDGDIAIEFITVPLEEGDEYVAISIKKGYLAPHFTKLASYKDISAIRKSRLYTTSKLYNLVWKPLKDELDGVKNVFFSPTGVLYSTGIEYLPDDNGVVFCSDKNVYRLSSTKELIVSNSHPLQEGILFGGLDYDASPSSRVVQNKNTSTKRTRRSVPLDSIRYRGGMLTHPFDSLPETLKEVQDISSILKSKNKSTILFTQSSGTEAAIKSITGTSADFLHIATHGFYFSNKKLGQAIPLESVFRKSVLSSEEIIKPLYEDKMLTRSGLIMAGANNSIKKTRVSYLDEDGILYADEIANLNLSNIDLLVLSACQSGLGDIASSEGVFGLQRGFKLAGVHSIVMSMWEVDDEFTRMLMTKMYEYLGEGQSKHQAFTNAQKELRLFLKKYNDGVFDEPEYWAAFVLLDGLE